MPKELAKFENVDKGDTLVFEGHIYTVLCRDYDFRQIIVRDFHGFSQTIKQHEFTNGKVYIS